MITMARQTGVWGVYKWRTQEVKNFFEKDVPEMQDIRIRLCAFPEGTRPPSIFMELVRI
jgi:hypothetical protein